MFNSDLKKSLFDLDVQEELLYLRKQLLNIKVYKPKMIQVMLVLLPSDVEFITGVNVCQA